MWRCLNEVEYTYKVQAVRRLGGELLASPDSPLRTAKPVKLTPPPPLLGLLAVATDQGVELHWDASPAADLAGYRVYRRGPGAEKPVLLTPKLLTKPYFVDSQVTRGPDLLLLRHRGGQQPPGQREPAVGRGGY